MTTPQPTPSPPATAAQPPPSSPGRHLLKLIVDALQMPEPAGTPEDVAAYQAMACRRAGLVLYCCQRALAGPGEGAVIQAARDLYDGVSGMQPVTYRHAPQRQGTST
jgi:hypothetical protein